MGKKLLKYCTRYTPGANKIFIKYKHKNCLNFQVHMIHRIFALNSTSYVVSCMHIVYTINKCDTDNESKLYFCYLHKTEYTNIHTYTSVLSSNVPIISLV